jgi:RimJ/RimL family protein N-acetyltransferase
MVASPWIPYNTILTGRSVDLMSLDEKHFPELKLLAEDKRIWEYYVYDGSNPDKFQEILESALAERKKGNQFPFVIVHKADNRLIGSTRFLDIQPKHKKLEIGTTWLHPDYWGTEVNIESKLLLLTFCFETLCANRVQLKTDENNIRSRKAIEKIGGRFEGIIRNDMVRDNNTKRNSALYSIVDEEWNEKKSRLTVLLQDKRNISG